MTTQRNHDTTTAEAEANACLIAAAPELLAALKQLASDWPFLADRNDETEINGADFLDAVSGWFYDVAAPAIAKAEGKIK